jgi:hypothetical protein
VRQAIVLGPRRFLSIRFEVSSNRKYPPADGHGVYVNQEMGISIKPELVHLNMHLGL